MFLTLFVFSFFVWIPLCCCARPKKSIVIVTQVHE
jgi:hypothetical protein